MKDAQKHGLFAGKTRGLFAVIPAQAGIQKSLIYMKIMKDMKKGFF